MKKVIFISFFNLMLLMFYFIYCFVIFNKNLELFRGDFGCDGGLSSEVAYSPSNYWHVKYNMIICGGGPIEYRFKLSKNSFPYNEIEILNLFDRVNSYSYNYAPDVEFHWVDDKSLNIYIFSYCRHEIQSCDDLSLRKSVVVGGFYKPSDLRINFFVDGEKLK